jgi:hypothetical protein
MGNKIVIQGFSLNTQDICSVRLAAKAVTHPQWCLRQSSLNIYASKQPEALQLWNLAQMVCEPSLILLTSKRPFFHMRSCCKSEVSRYTEHSTACVPHYTRLRSLWLLKRIRLNLVTLTLQRLSAQPAFKISGHDSAEWSKNIIEIKTSATSIKRIINPFDSFILFKNSSLNSCLWCNIHPRSTLWWTLLLW